ncbi:hypothetical protein XA68_15058 [Ophiocordyceps unilateralis]|uniref:Glycerol-3-phosphate dehydrogenase n=1 Tax=Ophiocordyceps unilateralis TaxID=268505 RepID=A0A2A9P9B2_OPHUN|nr:hypothetical protein XA68_15058 [Ophiocordyceps unilateralis]
MPPRFSRALRPLGAVVAAGGGVVIATVGFRRHRQRSDHGRDAVMIRRDATGRILPPTFPSVADRAQQLAALRRSGKSNEEDSEYDLIVIGGGATGSGIALDAVTRGLKVALVEGDDFSAGTSSKSTKLVHGGVRYLEKAVWNLDWAQLQLVMEALRERRAFLDIAPHLSGSLPILLPLQRLWQAPYLWAGCKMYDLLAGSHALESSYMMSRTRALEACPLLRRDRLVGALVYYDGQHNDSRMNVSLALTAALYGATVVNHVHVVGLEKDDNGRVRGVRVQDLLHGNADEAFTVRARGVVNATGPFTDAVERMDDPSRKPIVAPASGAHVMLPGSLCPNGMGILDAQSSDGRVVFVLPWQGKTVAGTTDNTCDVEREPVARRDDVDFILAAVGKLLGPESAPTRDDVLATWSGIRPLVKDPDTAGKTEALVRSHLVTVSSSGLLTCTGGKWTTYRQMAQDAVDEAIRVFDLKPRTMTLPDISGLGLPGITTDGTCRTRHVPVIGAHGYSPDLPSQLTEHYGVDNDIAYHLSTNYGDRAWAVLSDPRPSAKTRLSPSFPFIEAEIRYAVRHEAACTAADVISRRMRLSFLDVDQALQALPRVIDVMADELGWPRSRRHREWNATVRFLRSMGLPEDKLDVTRDHVLSRLAKPPPRPTKSSLPGPETPSEASIGGARTREDKAAAGEGSRQLAPEA